MESFVSELIKLITGGASHPGFVALLVLLTGGMGYLLFKRETEAKEERKELIEKFQHQIEGDRKDLLEVIDKYQEGQISVLEAINEIKVLIATIGAKL